MKVLLDTNVVLDVLLKRAPWLDDAEEIWQAGSDGRLECHVGASALTDIYYISRRMVGPDSARDVVRECLDSLEILPVDKLTLEDAHSLAGSDFEDALQIASAVRNGVDAIVTRDSSGFGSSPVEVLSPPELVARLDGGGP